jgi:hypothetical protein
MGALCREHSYATDDYMSEDRAHTPIASLTQMVSGVHLCSLPFFRFQDWLWSLHLHATRNTVGGMALAMGLLPQGLELWIIPAD